MEVALFLDASLDLVSLPRRPHQLSGKAQGKVQGYDSEAWIRMKSPVVTSQQTPPVWAVCLARCAQLSLLSCDSSDPCAGTKRETAARGTLD